MSTLNLMTNEFFPSGSGNYSLTASSGFTANTVISQGVISNSGGTFTCTPSCGSSCTWIDLLTEVNGTACTNWPGGGGSCAC
jgi:hypothetical protein